MDCQKHQVVLQPRWGDETFHGVQMSLVLSSQLLKPVDENSGFEYLLNVIRLFFLAFLQEAWNNFSFCWQAVSGSCSTRPTLTFGSHLHSQVSGPM